MNIMRLIFIFLMLILGSNAYAQERQVSVDSCPAGFDRSTAMDGGLYLLANMDVPLNSPTALAPQFPENVSINRADARSYFYFMKRGTQLPSGAIAVRRVYSVVNSSIPKDVVILTNNQDWIGTEKQRRFGEYFAYHQNPLGNNNRFRQSFHFKYENSQVRTDDRQDKVTALQMDQSNFINSNINKMMLLRYLGIRADGTCIRFNLFSERSQHSRGLLSITRSFFLEVQELEGVGGRALPRVRLNISIL
ncbi:MAG: hypothetical protein ABJ081_05185 [Hyphomicrobiales bacterium]